MPLSIGSTAPDFSLINTLGKIVSLKDYAGKQVVLLFFPFANSSVCEEEMCTTRDNIKKYEELDAEVLGISVDSHYSLKLWVEKLNLNFPLLSDFNKEASQKYDSYNEIHSPGKYDYKGVSKRSAFVIGKDGKIKYAEICEHTGLQPDYEAIKNSLKNN
ncbi:MAG TPA: peroxiredoxin [Ignavibacteriaceae bacterium]|nr:peroxiredoxin [Ignavibacteriaceae bacterium]